MAEESISGTLERITFHNEENGFAVLQVKAPGRRDLVTVVGHVPLVKEGEYIDARGEWQVDQKYGPQFKAEVLTATPPTTAEGIRRYLASGLVRGIGPEYAGRLVETFVDRVFDVIENEPQKLNTVPGIGPKRRQMIVASWEGQKSVRRIMLFLLEHGVGPLRAVRIWKTYGADAVARIRLNPYCLADDVRGIGFQIADKIAGSLGVDPHSIERARAGLRYVLAELLDEGHAACPQEELLRHALELLEIPRERLDEALKLERDEGNVLREEVDGAAWIYLTRLWHAESGVARLLRRLAGGPHPLALLDPPAAVALAEKSVGIELSPSQREAVLTAARHKVMVLTGGPGVGKTTIVRVILELYRSQDLSVLLAAPTGRAAKRLTEICGIEGKTLHRLLEADPATGLFRRNQARPLAAYLIVVDEGSMIDLTLMHGLLLAAPPRAALLVVGDVDQLPSVGPGLVLADMIGSGTIPVARLAEIFRQDRASQIVVSAHAVNRGRLPRLDPPEQLSDFYFVEAEEPEEAQRLLVRLVADRIPARFGFNSVRDIQVIVPMVRGTLGVRALNDLLQRELNPRSPEERIERFGRIFGIGDKVMQLANDYDRDVFNGDIGTIGAVDGEAGELTVDFEGRIVAYGVDDLEDLTPAYAITIHKSQGCEFPAVVIVLHTQHYVMLQRNLLYTAISRGRRLVVVMGSTRAVAIAVRQAVAVRRYTALRKRLQGELSAGR